MYYGTKSISNVGAKKKDLMTNFLSETCENFNKLKSFQQAIMKWIYEKFSSQLYLFLFKKNNLLQAVF